MTINNNNSLPGQTDLILPPVISTEQKPIVSPNSKKVHEQLIASPELLKLSSLVDSLKDEELTKILADNPTLFGNLNLGSIVCEANSKKTGFLSVFKWSHSVLHLLHLGKHNNDLFKVEKSNILLSDTTQLINLSERIDEIKTKLQKDELSKDQLVNIIDQLSKDIALKIRNLAPGESFHMEGGINDSDTMYRFTKQENGCYTVAIYHMAPHDTEQVQNSRTNEKEQKKVQNPILFCNVTIEELFFTDDKDKIQHGIFQSLVEMLFLNALSNAKINFSYKDMWNVFSRIHHRFVSEHKNPLFTQSRDDVSAQKTFNTFLLDRSGNKKEFKAYSFNSKLLGLVNLYHALAKGEADNPDNQILMQLRLGAENICKKLLKYSKTPDEYPELTENQMLKYYATALDILKRVELLETKAKEHWREQTRQSNARIARYYLDTSYSDCLIQSYPQAVNAQVVPLKPASEDYVWPNAISAKNFKTELNRYYENHCNLLKTDNKHKMRKSIEKFLSLLQIPIRFPDDPYWSEATLDQNSLKQLRDIFGHYCEAVGEINSAGTLIEHNTIMQAVAVMHQLCWRIDRESGKNYLAELSVGSSIFNKILIEDPHLLIKEPEQLERRKKLNAYFKSITKKEDVFDYGRGLFTPAEQVLYKKMLMEDAGAFEAFKLAKLADPKYINLKAKSNLKDNDICLISLLEDKTGDTYCFQRNPHIWQARQVMIDALACLGVSGDKTTDTSNSVQYDYYHFVDPSFYSLPGSYYAVKLSGPRVQAKASYFDKSIILGSKHYVTKEIAEVLQLPSLKPYFERNQEKTTELSQGRFLVDSAAESDEKRKKYALLASVLSDGNSSITNLIYRLRNYPDWVEDETARSLVEHILYKPDVKGAEIRVPLFESLKDHPEQTLEQFRKLIEEGLRLHLFEKDAQHIDFSAALFLIKLAHQLQRAYIQLHQKNPPKLYDNKVFEILENIITSRNEISYPSLFNLLLHKIDQMTLSSPQEWTPNEWKEVYANWLIIHTLSDVELYPQVDQNLLLDVKKRMFEIEPYLNRLSTQNPRLLDEILNHAIIELGIGIQPGTMVLKKVLKNNNQPQVAVTLPRGAIKRNALPRNNIKFKRLVNKLVYINKYSKNGWERIENGKLIFTKSLDQNNKITINLSTGELASNQGLQTGLKVDTKNKHFLRVFENRALNFGYGKTVYFDDKYYGRCRILNNDMERGIQRLIGDRWYTYIPPENISNDGVLSPFPSILKEGFTHWTYCDALNKKYTMIISELSNGKSVYEIDENGTLHPLGKKDIRLQSSYIRGFEFDSNLLVWMKEIEGNKLGFFRFEFFSYKDKNGKVLSFTKDADGNYCYDSDPNFHYSSQREQHVLGFFRDFIELDHKKNNLKKILIPIKKIHSQMFSPEANISDRFMIPQKQPQKGMYKYIEFNVEGGEIIGDYPIENWLVLANIYAAQKNYIQALKCLNQISNSEKFDRPVELLELFSNLISINQQTEDRSPNACAFMLRAYIKLKTIGALSIGPIQVGDINKIYESYLNGLNSVHAELRLPNNMEKKLLGYLDDKYPERKAFLDSGKSFIKRETFKKFNSLPDLKNAPVYLHQYEWIPKDVDLLKQLHEIKVEDNYFSQNFFTIYQTLKSSTKSERENLMYRLQIRRKYMTQLTPLIFSLIHFVYKHPDIAPELPVQREENTMLQWVQSLLNVYRGSTVSDSRYENIYSSDLGGNFIPKEVIEAPVQLEKAEVPFNLTTTFVSADKTLENRLTKLKTKFLNKKPIQESHPDLIKLVLDPKELNKSEKHLQEIIKNEFAEFNDNLAKGKKRQISDSPYDFKKGVIDEAVNELTILRNQATMRCQQLEIALLKEVNRLPVDKNKQMEVALTRIGLSPSEITIMDLAKAAGSGKVDRYKKMLPHFSMEEIETLHNQVVEFLAEQTTADHISRVLKPLEQMKETSSETEKRSLCLEAAAALGQVRSYSVNHDNLAALYFEFASEVRLREEQSKRFQEIVDALFDLKNNNLLLDKGIVFQMIQGAGKSAVMLSRLLELISERGYSSILVCHHSQIEAAKGSMKKYQRKRFSKDISVIDYNANDLEKISVLKEFNKKLKDARDDRNVIIISNTLLQSIQNTLIEVLLKSDTDIDDDKIDADLKERVNLLLEINHEIKKNGVGMLDEVDLILNIFQRVNIPIGESIHVSQSKIDLFHHIFEVLGSDECEALLHLSNNKQQDYSDADYWEKIVPLIAQGLTNNYKEMLIEDKYKDAYQRYLLNLIPKDIEKMARGKLSEEKYKRLSAAQKDDYEFMKYLHCTLAGSVESSKREAAYLIGLSRGIVRKVLPFTLRKSFNRDYGFDEKNPQSIIPFLGVDSPSDTEFGNVNEHLSYCFQAALNSAFPELAVRNYVKILKQSAETHVLLDEVNFDDTDEAQEFYSMTGVRLSAAFDNDNMRIATEAINKTKKTRLYFANELANFFVKFHPKFISSTPPALVDQFKTILGCSATINNANSFSLKMKEVLADKGAEGKVISTLFDRTNGGQDPLIVIDSQELPKMLSQCLDVHPPNKVQFLVDGGALFKKFTALEVARGALQHFKDKGNDRIKGVLFYNRSKNDQKKGEKFTLLKINEAGEEVLISLDDTTRDSIEGHGLKMDQIFVSLDELRATGTDIPMPPDAVGTCTVSAEAFRIDPQEIMRAREYFKGQDVKLAINQTTVTSLLGNKATYLAVIKTGLKNQAITKSEETFRSLKEQIPNCIRTQLIQHLLEKRPTVSEAAKLVKGYESFFVTTIEDKAYEEFAFIEEEGTPDEIIEELGKVEVNQFTSVSKILDETIESEIRKTAVENNKNLKVRAGVLPELKRKFVKTPGAELGLQFRQTEKVALENKLHVSMQMRQEEHSYDITTHAPCFQEVPWNGSVLKQFNSANLGPKVFSVSEILEDFDRSDGWITIPGLYRKDYSQCFPQNVLMTENLRFTTQDSLPVFHKLQKPAENVLLHKMNDGYVECIMLSQRDAEFWIRQGKTPTGVWLLNPEGDQLIPSVDVMPGEEDPNFWDEKETALWYVNFFNGNVIGLEKRSLITQVLLDTDDNLLQQFLYLRTSHQSKQRQMLDISPLYNLNRNVQSGRPVCKKRFARVLEQRRNVAAKTKKEIEALKADQVQFVPPEKVKDLNKLEQIRRLNRTQINHMNPEYVQFLSPRQALHLEDKTLIQALQNPTLIRALSTKSAALLLPEQEKHHVAGARKLTKISEIQAVDFPPMIHGFGPDQMAHLLPKQIPHINIKYIKHLKLPEQIRALQGKIQINAIDASMIPHLSEQQIAELRDPKLVKMVPGDRVKFVHNDVIALLDELTQLPYLERRQYIYVSQKQHETINNLENLPDNLKQIWRHIGPEALNCYKDILRYVGKSHLTTFQGTEWSYILGLVDSLKDEDYLGEIGDQDSVSFKSERSGLLPPPEIFKCKNIDELNLDGCDKSLFEKEMVSISTIFPVLRNLTICNSDIHEVPADIRNLKDLQYLKIQETAIEFLPAWLGELSELHSLYLIGNKLKKLPTEIGKLQNLERLYLQHNNLESLPEDIGYLGNLKYLGVSNNLLEAVPQSITQLKNILEIYLHMNKLKSLPTGLSQCKTLDVLTLHDNELSSLPDDLSKKVFNVISYFSNPLGEVPKVLYELQPYQSNMYWFLPNCGIKHLSASSLPSLKYENVYFDANPLEELPEEIGTLTNIKKLSLEGTHLETLPKSLENLKNLELIVLAHTKITELPDFLLRLPKLKEINLHGCLIDPESESVLKMRAAGINVNFNPPYRIRGYDNIKSNEIPSWKYEGKADPDEKPVVKAETLNNFVAQKRIYELFQLVNSGLDPNTVVEVDGQSMTLVQWALNNEQDLLVEKMVRKGYDPKQIKYAFSPISLLCRRKEPNAELIELFMQSLGQNKLSAEDTQHIFERIKLSKSFIQKYKYYQLIKNRIEELPVNWFSKKLIGKGKFRTWLGELLHRATLYWKYSRAIKAKKLTESIIQNRIGYALYTFGKEFSVSIENVNQQLDNLVAGKITIDTLEKSTKIDRTELIKLAKQQGRQDVISQIMITEMKLDPKLHHKKAITNLFLDKTLVMATAEEEIRSRKFTDKESLYGMRAHVAGMTVANGIKNVLKNSSSVKPKLREHLQNDLYSPMVQACYWERLMVTAEGRDKVVDELMQVLANLKINERVLVPTGNKFHNVLIQVKRTSEQEFSLKVVNTSEDSYHPTLENSSKFQTVLPFVDIPKRSIFQRDSWQEVIQNAWEPENRLYEIVTKQLVKDGKKVPHSKDPFDYSSGQLQNTCPATPWWHWLKNEVSETMQEDGDRWSAYVEWRLLKKEIRESILETFSDLKSSDSAGMRIHQAATGKINKHAQLVNLMDVAKDRDKFNKAFQHLRELASSDKSLYEDLESTLGAPNRNFDSFKNPGSRWKLLHQLSNRIAQEAQLNQKLRDKLLESKDAYHLQFILFTLADFEFSEKCLSAMLEDLAKQKRWFLLGHALGELVQDQKMWMLAVSLSKKWLAKGPKMDDMTNVYSSFIHVLRSGKNQGRVLWELAKHFKHNVSLSNLLWRDFRILRPKEFLDRLENEEFSSEEIPLALAKIDKMQLEDSIRLLGVLRHYVFDKSVVDVAKSVVDHAIKLEEEWYSKLPSTEKLKTEEYAHLKQVTEFLYRSGYDLYAQHITDKVLPRLKAVKPTL